MTLRDENPQSAVAWLLAVVFIILGVGGVTFLTVEIFWGWLSGN